MATTETMFPDQSDMDYDYDTLRTTGVILAAIMCVSGIVIALTHPRPKFQKQTHLLKLYRKYRKCRKTEGRLRGSHRPPYQQQGSRSAFLQSSASLL